MPQVSKFGSVWCPGGGVASPHDMNVLPCCTGCRCGRCLMQPSRSSALPGAGWSYRPGSTPFARVEQLRERVWLVVEDDRFCEHPFLYIVLGGLRTVVVDTGVGTASYGDWLAQWLAARGPSVAARPLLVVNSHCHCAPAARSNPPAASTRCTQAAASHPPSFPRQTTTSAPTPVSPTAPRLWLRAAPIGILRGTISTYDIETRSL